MNSTKMSSSRFITSPTFRKTVFNAEGLAPQRSLAVNQGKGNGNDERRGQKRETSDLRRQTEQILRRHCSSGRKPYRKHPRPDAPWDSSGPPGSDPMPHKERLRR